MFEDGGDGSASRDGIDIGDALEGDQTASTGDSTASRGDSTAAVGDGTASDGTASDGTASSGFGVPEGRETGKGLPSDKDSYDDEKKDSLFWGAVSYVTGLESQGIDTLLGSFWSTEAEEYGPVTGHFFSGEPQRGGDKPIGGEYPETESNRQSAVADGGETEEVRGVTRRGVLQGTASAVGLGALGISHLGGGDSGQPSDNGAAANTTTATTTPEGETTTTTETPTETTTTSGPVGEDEHILYATEEELKSETNLCYTGKSDTPVVAYDASEVETTLKENGWWDEFSDIEPNEGLYGLDVDLRATEDGKDYAVELIGSEGHKDLTEEQLQSIQELSVEQYFACE
jgi:hypothetical protein